jgi:hypothetical protein
VAGLLRAQQGYPLALPVGVATRLWPAEPERGVQGVRVQGSGCKGSGFRV